MSSLLRSPSSELIPLEVNTQPLVLLQEREEELELVLAKLDEAQAEFDRRSSTVAEKQIEVESKYRELERDRAARRARELEPIPVGGVGSDSQFTPDQISFLKSKRDEIESLNAAIEKFEQKVDVENDAGFLRQDLASLKSESVELTKRIQRTVLKRRKQEDAAEFSRGQRRETKNQIRAYRKVVKDAEHARASLIDRQHTLTTANDSKSGLRSVVLNLEEELNRIGLEGDELDEQIRTYKEQSDRLKGPEKGSARQQERAAEWMQGMDESFEAIQETAVKKKSDLDSQLKLVSQLESRYRKLCPIAMAWRKHLDHDPNKDDMSDIDDLLRQIPKYEKEPESSRIAELKELTVNNVEMEAQIARLRRELTQALQSLTNDENKLKKQILDQRKGCSDREKVLVDEIHVLKLRLAQKKLK
jgi:chromosome segregation ATPase